MVACLLAINLVFAPRNPYMEKNSAFECGFSSFLGQNRTQFSISFFIFALLFLLFDLEILLVYPYLVSAYVNEIYGLVILLVFLLALTIGFVFELGKKALTIDSRQTYDNKKEMLSTNESKDYNSKNNVHNLVSVQSSFMDYNIFSKSFWNAYLVKLKSKFTFNNIVSTLLTIIFVYFFRGWLVHSSDWDLSIFTEYLTIGLSISVFSKIVKASLEQICEGSGASAKYLEKIPMGPLEKMPMGSSGQNEMGNKTNVKPLSKAFEKGNLMAMEQGRTSSKSQETKEAAEQMEIDRPSYSTQERVQSDKGKFLVVEPEKDSSRGRINIRSDAEIEKESQQLREQYVAKTNRDRDNYRDECMAKEVPVQDEDWCRREFVAKQEGYGQEHLAEKINGLYNMTASLTNLHHSIYDQEHFQNVSDYITGAITDLKEIDEKRLKACLDRRSYHKEHTELSSGLTDDMSRDLSPNKPDIDLWGFRLLSMNAVYFKKGIFSTKFNG